MSTLLFRSVDGKGLSSMPETGDLQYWIVGPEPGMSGCNYIGAIQCRGNLLYTRARAARGRPDRPVDCDACGQYEALSHVLQVCYRTFGERIRRHNKIVLLIARAAQRAGFTTYVEPKIPTPRGLLVPDLIVMSGETTYVIDPTVVADNADLATEASAKRHKYDVPGIRNWILEKEGRSKVELSGIAVTWRGALAKDSYVILRRLLGAFRAKVLYKTLVKAVIESSYFMYRFFRRSTTRTH